MKITKFIALFLIIAFAVSCKQETGKISMNNSLDSVSYCIGVSIAQNYKEQGGTEFNYEVFTQAMKQVLSNDTALLVSPERSNMVIREYFTLLRDKKYEKNAIASKEFLEKNKKEEGVVALPSGLQYKVIKNGNGPKPQPTDMVTAHYRGTLIDGREFDSSLKGQPANFPVNGVIQGWQEALQLMTVGSKWMLYIPAEMAYGDNPRPGGIIEPKMALVFEVELISIESQNKQ